MFDTFTKAIVQCPFYCVPDMGALTHRVPTSTGACLDSRRAQRHIEKDICVRHLCWSVSSFFKLGLSCL